MTANSSASTLRLQRLGPTGARVGEPIVVAETSGQNGPTFAACGGRALGVSWYDGASSTSRFQLFDVNGAPIAPAVDVAESPPPPGINYVNSLVWTGRQFVVAGHRSLSGQGALYVRGFCP